MAYIAAERMLLQIHTVMKKTHLHQSHQCWVIHTMWGHTHYGGAGGRGMLKLCGFCLFRDAKHGEEGMPGTKHMIHSCIGLLSQQSKGIPFAPRPLCCKCT